MKKIVLLLFTFSGICNAFAQDTGGINLSPGQGVVKRPSAKLIPNPAGFKVDIELSGFDAGPVLLQIFDTKGTRFRNDKRLLFSGNEIITVMFALQAGVYLLVLKQNEKTVKRKLVVH